MGHDRRGSHASLLRATVERACQPEGLERAALGRCMEAASASLPPARRNRGLTGKSWPGEAPVKALLGSLPDRAFRTFLDRFPESLVGLFIAVLDEVLAVIEP